MVSCTTIQKTPGLSTKENRIINSNTSLTFRSGGDPLKGLNIAKNNAYFKGKSYALVIGIDNYKGNWNQLNNAVRDAQGFEQTLKQHYKIDVVKSLYDEHATRENIINAFVWLVDHVKEEDNVVIYYSGHGDYKKSLKKGVLDSCRCPNQFYCGLHF